jgi:hypothetical protein
MAKVVIDLNQAGLDLDAEEMDIPDGAMSGAAAFLLGILKAEVSAKNLGAMMKWLWNVRPNTVLKVSYKKGDREVNLEYRTPEQLEQQLEAIQKIDSLMVQLVQVK